MKKSNVQKTMITMSVLLLVAGCFAAFIPTAEAQGKTIYLKGSGGSFNLEGWNNVHYLGESNSLPSEYQTVWHLVIAPPKASVSVTYMQLVFTNGETFTLNDPIASFSTNPAGNNPGWVIVAPGGWELDYVNSGNNNKSGCYLITNGDVNNFNIGGYTQGKISSDLFKVPEYTWGGLVAVFACFAALGLFYMSKNRRNTRLLKTSII
ncbi:MAG: hypothetical protein LBH62_07760 [Nitrososphaerota archaeon]|uniref:hypothetical protein n=1 Tax=Candidatus Bathycorpusculum sp. TaxID=2994959 RepID=UPI00281BEA87|nr:hypothetical protein [Candidatus Termiticorpusculum sp.]MCL2258001.1 hypothetical protein [Candidatus Termiticorpusculum sp.]MCL2291797.1 hypothetical protein [Candidatus Termiticorpusculum sp.]MDR0461300.1 hypothetical protein [Nitrososphaerota archaeon]